MRIYKVILSVVTLLPFFSWSQKLPDLKVISLGKPEYVDTISGAVVKAGITNAGKVKSPSAKALLYDLDISLEQAKKLKVKKEDYWLFEENTERAKEILSDINTSSNLDKTDITRMSTFICLVLFITLTNNSRFLPWNCLWFDLTRNKSLLFYII